MYSSLVTVAIPDLKIDAKEDKQEQEKKQARSDPFIFLAGYLIWNTSRKAMQCCYAIIPRKRMTDDVH
jgi:hypothetical protein